MRSCKEKEFTYQHVNVIKIDLVAATQREVKKTLILRLLREE